MRRHAYLILACVTFRLTGRALNALRHDDAAPEGIIGRMMMTLVAAFVLVLAAGAA